MTLQYSVADQLVVHELSFNEAIDLTAQRYKVSIGYISYEPTVYYATKSGPAISAVNGQCKPVAHPSTLIPELSWFTDLMLPGVDLKAALAKNPFLVGPSGLIAAVLDLGNSSEAVC